MISRIFRKRGGPIVLALLAGAVALVFMLIPKTKYYSDDGFGLYGRTQVHCGTGFDSKVSVSFSGYLEGQSYRTDSTYGEPPIFEGKTATQVCRQADKESRTAAAWSGGIGGVLFVIGLVRLSNTQPAQTFKPISVPAPSPRPAPRVTPPITAPSPAVNANPARWAADPFGRYDLRFWNGKKWTEHVARDGRQETDPPKPQVAPTKPAFAPPNVDHDGHTIRRSSPEPRRTLILTMNTGAKVEVRGLVAIGRGPAAVDGVQPVAVDDPLLSKSHLRVGLDENGPWVEDTHSTNGVDLLGSDGRTTRITPGHRTSVVAGSRVTFGDSWCDVAVATM